MLSCVRTETCPLTSNCLLPLPPRSSCDGTRGRGADVLVGMYQHDKTSGDRVGAIAAMSGSASSSPDDSCLWQLDLPGVFDMNFASPVLQGDREALLYVCCTDGSVKGVKWNSDATATTSTLTAGWSVPVHEEMVTSCTPVRGNNLLMCSMHGGQLALLEQSEASSSAPFTVSACWDGHEFDAWCVASFVEHHVWSGGDDGFLKLWDTRQPLATTSVMRKRLDAGVVTVNDIHNDGVRIVVGSYDEHVYIFDARNLKQPISSVHVGGGAWRCRALPTSEAGAKSRQVAVAAMQGGAVLLEIDDTDEGHVVASFHDSDGDAEKDKDLLIYDVAVLPPCGDRNDGITIATCSFYNRIVKFWQWSRNE